MKPEQCCSRAQGVNAIKRDPTVSTDAAGMLRIASRTSDPLQQILDCDRQLYTLASHKTMGKLSSSPYEAKPLDAVIRSLKDSTEG